MKKSHKKSLKKEMKKILKYSTQLQILEKLQLLQLINYSLSLDDSTKVHSLLFMHAPLYTISVTDQTVKYTPLIAMEMATNRIDAANSVINQIFVHHPSWIKLFQHEKKLPDFYYSSLAQIPENYISS